MLPAIGERLYRLLLRCYPGEFRDEYEQEMLVAFRDRFTHDRSRGRGALVRLWWQLMTDSVVRAPREHVDILRQDSRYALRSLRRSPVFAATAMATLAIGIGASTAIFSVVHAVILRPLPYDPNGRLIRIWEDNPSLAIEGFSVSLPNFLSWRERAQTVDLGGWMSGSLTLRGAGEPVRVPSVSATTAFFDLLGVQPLRGRLFAAADEVLNGPPVAMIGEGLWRSHFGEDAALVGRTVLLGERPYTVVGVIPRGSVPVDAEVFVPLRIDPAESARDNHVAQVLGRLRAGVSFDQARSELEGIARQLEQEFPESNRGWGVTLTTLYDWVVPPETRRALWVLLAAVGCVLLIACANVASLMLARTAGRRREMAVRLAIGAAHRRLVRQVLTEGLVLTALGGAAGILVAHWSVPLIRQWLPETLPRGGDATVNTDVLLLSLLVCGCTGLIFAAAPALSGSRVDSVDSLKDGSRGSTGAIATWRQLLAGAQMALATVLLVGAGLLLQSLEQLRRVELGFDPANVTTARMGLPGERYQGDAAWGFYARLLERLSSSPGIDSAGVTSGAPFDGGNTGMPIEAVGPSRLEGKSLQADWRMVSPGYFRTLRIPLISGRLFTGTRAADDRTIILSASMARRIWGDEDPLGRQIAAGPNGSFTVVGTVGDVRNLDLAREPAPTMYLSSAVYLWPTMTVVTRGRGPEMPVAPLLRTAVRELDPQLALFEIRNTIDRIDRSASQSRLNATLVGFFAGVAALLAALGIYGVLAYLVSQRQQEIGIRMALGASRSTVVRLILGRGFRLTAAGLAVGVAVALWTSRYIQSLMFGVSPTDPLTFAGAIALVALVALVASYAPARRATRVDPLVALRSE